LRSLPVSVKSVTVASVLKFTQWCEWNILVIMLHSFVSLFSCKYWTLHNKVIYIHCT
jgi:hypothetical protein